MALLRKVEGFDTLLEGKRKRSGSYAISGSGDCVPRRGHRRRPKELLLVGLPCREKALDVEDPMEKGG